MSLAPREVPVPKGFTPRHGDLSIDRFPYNRFLNNFRSIRAPEVHKRTFDVHPMHQKSNNNGGVVFNVETCPDPLPEHIKLPKVSPNPIEGLEVMSSTPSDLVYSGSHGFLAACMTAFAYHLPLSLDPNDFWTIIMYMLSKHVEGHAEELRHNFVAHKGKKTLKVYVDHFVMNYQNGVNNNQGTSAELWERDVFPDFSKQIKEYIGDEMHENIVANFSTTTPVTKAVSEIGLMSITKNYFEYKMYTLCGIPKIELKGSRDDWVMLRTKTEELSQTCMTKEFSTKWMKVLLPILDEFIKSYDGNVNHSFWQTMVKFRTTGGGSGSHTFLSGWIQNLYPILKNGSEARRMSPWQEDAYFEGPEPDDLPAVECSAPVTWNYNGADFPLSFNAGFNGFCQAEDGTISPSIGWHVVHGAPQGGNVGQDLMF